MAVIEFIDQIEKEGEREKMVDTLLANGAFMQFNKLQKSLLMLFDLR